MTILEEIIAKKRIEIQERKSILSISGLERNEMFGKTCLSMENSLETSASGIIAEFKRKSPSKGWIHPDADVNGITASYSRNGASGISILTDFPYFGGTLDDLINARQAITCPVLRKDFMIDEYQIFEAKSCGADIILLIAAALTTGECKTLARRARELGLETLLEVHNADELGHINEFINIVGVNNRNLKTFEVSIDISFSLAMQIPPGFIKISESGISNPSTVKELREAGYKGFLMGENFMKEKNPAEALKNFIAAL